MGNWGRVNIGSGGGGGLNFEVIGGTSAPSSPKENTIWVNTAVAITSWVFSATAPTSPVAGMVWFKTNVSSVGAFNAIKKNGLWVYPTAGQQYISGAWVVKTVKTWQNSTWADWWNGELYTPGDTWDHITGGWGRAARGTELGSITASSLKTSDNIVALGNLFFTKKTIDLRNYTSLKATVTVTATAGNYPKEQFAAIGFSSASFTDGENIGTKYLEYTALFDIAGVKTTTVGTTTLSVDISELSSGVVVLGFGWTTGSCSKIWLE